MKKVALMTWYDNENYGSALQAYALQSQISCFADCEIIPYKSQHPGYGLKDIVNPVLRNNLMWKIYERLFLNNRSDVYSQSEQIRREYMLNFFEEKLNIANIANLNEIQEYVNREYDAVVCGSDQIWNPTRYDKHFFLDFVNNEIPKIAYAPSFGVSKITDRTVLNEISKLLLRFDCLSVREKAGQQMISELIRKEIPVCLDPTLLQSERFWNQLADESRIDLPEKYAYCYLLGRNKRYFNTSKAISQTLGLRFLQQPYHISDYMNECEFVPPSGPADFLNAIRKSEFVCTDSFHGAIFAILFEKPFVIFKRFKSTNGSSQNSRIETLLQVVGLENRLEIGTSPSKNELMDIRFDRCKERLGIVRNESINYLKNALNLALHCEDY